MKECPQCSAQYDDTTSFCARDGRSLVAMSRVSARLCPHCANSIDEDAKSCPYCKADLDAGPSPQWLIRDEPPSSAKSPQRTGTMMTPRTMLFAGIILCVIAAALLGMGVVGSNDSDDMRRIVDEKVKELQVKDEHIKAAEAEVAKAREEAATHLKEELALKAQLEQSEKARATAEERLGVVNRQLERLSSRQTRIEPKNPPRPAERSPTQPRPGTRPAEPGVYETVRATEVHEEASESSRIISRVGKGTRVNVVRSNGDWLEVVSRRGNPPGFILRNDTTLVTAAK